MNSGSRQDSRPLPILSDEDVKPSNFEQWSKWAEDYWTYGLNILGGICLAGYQIPEASWGQQIVFWLGVVAFGIGNYGLLRQAPRITRLKAKAKSLFEKLEASEEAYSQLVENTHLANRKVVDPRLEDLATKLKFGDSERISVYKNAGGIFSMLGRYSERPEYHEQGRRSYPATEGCIGYAYQNGFAEDDSIPDSADGLGAYCDHMEKRWRIDRATCGGLRMKPRNIMAFAFNDPSSRRRIGVIVFESTRKDRLSRVELEETLQTEVGKQVRDIAAQLEAVKANLRTAIDEEL